MSRRRIRNILLKEWKVLFTDLNSTMIVTVLPLLIVGQIILYIWLASRFGGDAMLSSTVFQNALGNLIQAKPAVGALPANEQLQVLLISQFNFYILLVPTMIAISVATFSIVDEKVTGSLEALLATPVRTWELLMGKALAGAIPAIIITWIATAVFFIIINIIEWGHLISMVISPSWFIILLLLTPVITLLSFLLGVIGSSRARDAKGAQNLVVLIILPVFGLIALQITGVLWFDTISTLALTLGLIIVDFLVLKIAVRLFNRDSIVAKWR